MKLRFSQVNLRQVTWLVVTKVRSEGFGLVTRCCHYNACAVMWGQFYFYRRVWYCVLSLRACAMRVFNVRASSSPPRLPRVPNFVSVMPSIAEIAHGKKWCTQITHSITQSLTHSLTQLIWSAGNRSLSLRKSNLETS